MSEWDRVMTENSHFLAALGKSGGGGMSTKKKMKKKKKFNEKMKF
jgi:hypothetical protein